MQDLSRRTRKQALSQYLFVCECEKCQRELEEDKVRKAGKVQIGSDYDSDDSSDDD